MRRSASGLGLLVFFSLVGLVYAMASPYGAPPDEPTHYVKALATGSGDLFGEPAKYPGDRSQRQKIYMDSVTRRFRVPERLAPPEDDEELCFILKPAQPAACPNQAGGEPERLSYVGVYPPLPYVAPGLAARLGTNKSSGLLAARLASGVCALALVAIAVVALNHPDAPALSLLGITMVLWPGLMFLTWGLNPNGTEVVASVAFFAALLALTREEAPPRWLWIATAVTGFLLCTSRPLAPVWALFGLAMAVLLIGPRAAIARVRAGGRAALLMGAAIGTGGLATAIWTFVMYNGRPADTVSWTQLVVPALESVPGWVKDMVGRLAWSEVTLSQPIYDAWFIVLAAAAALAIALGTWRQRLACLAMAAAFLTMTVLFFVLTHPSGYPMGARYVQAGMTALPLLWVEVLVRNRWKLSRWAVLALVSVVALLVAATQLDALFRNGRRFAVGVDGPARYLFGGALWEPPGGWWPWVLCALLGVTALLAALGRDLVSAVAGVPGRPAKTPDASHR